MSSGKLRYLWDACCYVAILKREPPFDALLRTLEDVREGRIELIASTMAISEVIRVKGTSAPIPRPESEQKVREFFENDYIIVRSHDRYIAELGRELCWDHNLNPRDAIHVATALQSRCDIMETLDHKLLSINGMIKGIEIRYPRWSGQIQIDDLIDAQGAAKTRMPMPSPKEIIANLPGPLPTALGPPASQSQIAARSKGSQP